MDKFEEAVRPLLEALELAILESEMFLGNEDFGSREAEIILRNILETARQAIANFERPTEDYNVFVPDHMNVDFWTGNKSEAIEVAEVLEKIFPGQVKIDEYIYDPDGPTSEYVGPLKGWGN